VAPEDALRRAQPHTHAPAHAHPHDPEAPSDAGEQDERLAERLRAAGHRITVARRAVWAALSTAHPQHLTVDEVTDRAHHLGWEIDRASVYRTLALLGELGLARMSQLGPAEPARWEPAHPDEHFHLVCLQCGGIDHHVGDLVAQVREHLAAGHGFQAHTVTLSVEGVCADCSATT
jgi:Fur family transcriptional regulator, ferric uptake regulator